MISGNDCHPSQAISLALNAFDAFSRLIFKNIYHLLEVTKICKTSPQSDFLIEYYEPIQ